MARERVPNEQLRALIEESAQSYEAIARGVRAVAAENGEMLRTNKSAVAHWVAGTSPSGRASAYLAEVLSRRLCRPLTQTALGLPAVRHVADADLDPVDAATALDDRNPAGRLALAAATFSVTRLTVPEDVDPVPVERMRRAAKPGARCGTAEAEVIRGITAAFAAADERLGGGHGLGTVTAYLSQTVAPILRGPFTSQDARVDVFGAASELAYLAGFKHHDLGQEGAAQHCYRLAHRLARDASDGDQAAWMLRTMAQQALSLGHPGPSLDLADAAVDRAGPGMDPATRALLLITQARALAATGRSRRSAHALSRAEDLLSLTDTPQASYSKVSGPIGGTAASHMARALSVLGDHAAAQRRHEDALRLWDPVAYQRVHLLTYADLGDSLAAQNRAEAAVQVWTHVVDLAEALSSGRTRSALVSIRSQLALYRHRRVPGAHSLDQRLRLFAARPPVERNL